MTKEGMDTLLFKMDHIPDRFWNKASIELNETDENKVKGLGKLKELTEIYPTGITFPEDILLQFLRHSKFDVIKASTRLKRFVCFWRKHPELFASIPENYISSKASTKFGTILPFRCPDGCTILLTKPGLWDPSEMEFEDFKKLAFMLFIQPLCELMTQINGYKIIHDFGGTSVKHFKYCTPENLRLQYEAAMQCIPARYKEFHVVNGYGVFTAIWTLLKPLLSSKLRSRVFFHSKPEGLLNHFPRSILPKDYGGDLNDYIKEDFIRELNSQFGNSPLCKVKAWISSVDSSESLETLTVKEFSFHHGLGKTSPLSSIV